MENEIRKFRAEVTAIFRPVITLCSMGGLLVFLLFFIGDGFKFSKIMFEAFLILEAVLIPFISLIVLAGTFDNKITIYKNGLSSFDPFNNRKCDFIAWDKMNKIRTRNILGYKYLFIESIASAESLWLPLKIKHKEDFIELVRDQTGIEHKYPLYYFVKYG